MIVIMDGRFFLVIAVVLLLSFSRQQIFQLTKQPAQAVAPAHAKATRSHPASEALEASSSLTAKSATEASGQVKQLPAKRQILESKFSHHDDNKLAALQTQLDLQNEQLATLTSDLRTLEKSWAFEDWEFKHWWEQLNNLSTQASLSGELFLSAQAHSDHWWQACLAWFDEQLGILNWRVPQIFHDQVTFAHQAIFTDTTSIERLQMSEQSAGQLLLKSGETIAVHDFATPYQQAPLVFLSPVGQSSYYPYHLSVSETGFELELESGASIPLVWQWLVIDRDLVAQEF